MTPDDRTRIGTQERFATELGRLLERAHRNDLDIEGGWAIQTPSAEVPDWDVEIWRLGTASTRE